MRRSRAGRQRTEAVKGRGHGGGAEEGGGGAPASGGGGGGLMRLRDGIRAPSQDACISSCWAQGSRATTPARRGQSIHRSARQQAAGSSRGCAQGRRCSKTTGPSVSPCEAHHSAQARAAVAATRDAYASWCHARAVVHSPNWSRWARKPATSCAWSTGPDESKPAETAVNMSLLMGTRCRHDSGLPSPIAHCPRRPTWPRVAPSAAE